MLIIIPIFILAYIINFDSYVTSYTMLVEFIIFFIINIVSIIYLCKLFIWSRKQHIKIKNGERIRYTKTVVSRINKKLELTISNIIFTMLMIIPLLKFIFIFVNPYSNQAGNSSKTFLASSSTNYYMLKNDSSLEVTVFKSEYDFIINQYLNLYHKNYSETHFSEDKWEAKYTFNKGQSFIVVYDNCIISFENDEPLEDVDIKMIKALKD